MKSALEALDWSRACALLAAGAESPLGQRLVRALAPFQSRDALSEAVEAVGEAQALLALQSAPQFAAIDDLAPLLEAARQRGLDGKQLAQVLKAVKAGEFVRQRLVAREAAPRLKV